MAESMKTFDNPTTNGVVPTEVSLSKADIMAPRFTPRELALIKTKLGRSFSQITAEDDNDDKFAVIGWLKLRREGYPIEWEAMLDVVIALDISEMDPTSASPQTT